MEVRCLEMRAIIDEELEESNLNGMSGGSNNTIGNKFGLFQQLDQDIKDELCAHIWEVTKYNPLQFIISHTDHYQILYATVENKINSYFDNQGKDTGAGVVKSHLKLRNVIIGAIPIEITSHENPLGFVEHRYTIKFHSHTGKIFTITFKTLEEIVADLKERALVFESRGATEALSIIVGAFIKDNKIIINSDIETPGFYLVKGKIKAYHMDNNFQAKPSKNKIQKCVELLEILVAKYRRREIIPTVLKWAVLAPFNFAIKQHSADSSWLPWPYPYGWTRTGKSTLGKIACGVWSRYNDRKYVVPYTSVNTEAKLGYKLSQGTLPLTINEAGGLADDRNKGMLEMVKNSIETQIARSKHIHKTAYTDIPALCSCMLTSNSPPARDPGFRSKIIPIVFTKEDMHTQEEKIAFDSLMAQSGGQLKVLGDFSAYYIMNYQNALLKKKNEEVDWKETAKEIIIKFYEAAGRAAPHWIDLFVEQTQLEDSADDSGLLVRAFFINLINETFNKYYKTFYTEGNQGSTLNDRLNFCCEKGLIPSINIFNEENQIIIFSDIMKELRIHRSGIDGSEIASLQELSNTIGLEYGQKWLNGKNIRVAYGDAAKFMSFLDSEIRSNNMQKE